MRLKIEKELSPNASVDETDVLRMKAALNRLGYYFPHEKIGITGIPDGDLFAALKRFQVNNGLTGTGTAKPGDQTIDTLNTEISAATGGKYIWRTVEDDRVRPKHAALNGTVRDWSDSPDPGEEANCRCCAEPYRQENTPYEDAIEPVYPELYIIPFLRGGTFIKYAWMLWRDINKRDTEWTLGKYKKPQKWARQIEQRGWTPQRITDTIKYGTRHRAPNKVHPENTATRYEWNGNYIVQDDQTKEILQVGSPNFERNLLSDFISDLFK
jgi:hypothetical protein